MNVAIILAAGSGNRLGAEIPKQFLKVAGKQIIEHTLDVFDGNAQVDEVAVVTQAEHLHTVEEIILRNHYRKVRKVLVGGKERFHSSLSAIAAYTDDKHNLIFHDAVRPLVNERIIADCIAALDRYNAVDVAIKASDTIIQVDEADCITEIPPRSTLRYGQTPQCFKRGTIRRAYELAIKDPRFQTTDDCGVVRKYLPKEPIYVVRGEVFNMKVTYLEDLFLLDKLFQLRSLTGESRELSELAHARLQGKVMVVFGGSYGIGAKIVEMARAQGARVCSFSRSQNAVDVSDEGAVNHALEEVKMRHGRIDYVVCTAGVLVKEPLCNLSTEKIRHSVDVNYLGAVNVAKASHHYLAETRGSLLFFTSSSYTRGRMMYSIYSSTKAAIVNLTQALSEEWAAEKIRINCINPERTRTPMRTSNFGMEPAETLLDPKQVAVASINTLVSEHSGEVIDVRR